jgi:hypothetical protein
MYVSHVPKDFTVKILQHGRFLVLLELIQVLAIINVTNVQLVFHVLVQL